MLKIAVFVSGTGSNLKAIHAAIAEGRLDGDIRLVLSSRADAPALAWAASMNIPTALTMNNPASPGAADPSLVESVPRKAAEGGHNHTAGRGDTADVPVGGSKSPLPAEVILDLLRTHDIDFLVLAGYLKLIPAEVVRAFRHRIVNIHPALLPSFGGAGMYGRHVHEAVLKAGARVSGATVHIVDEEYDRGPIVAQECVPVLDGDTASSLAARVLEVEHRIYSEALQLFARNRVRVEDGKITIE